MSLFNYMNVFDSINAFGWTRFFNDLFPATFCAAVIERVR